MSYQFFKVQTNDTLAIVTISRPESLNALNSDVLKELSQVQTELNQSNIRVVLITGEGKAFVAGADIAEMKNFNGKQAKEFSEFGQKCFLDWETSPFVSIALLNGFTLGGGMELALACDIRIASEKALLGLPEVSLGILPGFGATQRLSRLIGISRASELIFTGDKIDATEAYRLGLVNRISSPEDLLVTGQKMAETILKQGPEGVRSAKRALRQGIDTHLQKGLAIEAQEFGSMFDHPQSKEGLSAFLEKRKPQFLP